MEHQAGEVLQGRYELRAVLARGATTITYAAFDRKHDRKVGVRHWPAEAGDPQVAAEELERAIAIGKRVAHMHLPRHVDHFELTSGRGRELYLVHDAGEGQALLARGASGARHEPELRMLATALLRLLAALHRLEIVHGRVRADEVLQRRDGRVYLLGTAAERDAQGGVAGDLRGVAETLLSARFGVAIEGQIDRSALDGLPRGLRAWLEALLAGSYSSADAALQALQHAPSGSKQTWIVAGAAGLVLLAGAAATSFWVLQRTEAFLKRPAAGREQGKAIADTRFQPKGTTSDSPTLELTREASMAGHWSAVMDVAFDTRGERVASASYDGSARLWQARDGAPLASFPHGGKVGSVAFQSVVGPDGAAVERVLSGAGTTLRAWDATGQALRSHDADTRQVTGIASTRDGTRLAAIGFDGKISVFDGASGALLRSMQQPPRGLALAIDTSGTRIASGGDDGVVRVFGLEDGALAHELRGHTRAIDALVFSSDGNTLASASDDHSVRIWYLPAQKLMHTLEGHRDEVWALAIDPAGKLLASGSKDGQLRLWDAYSGKLQLEWDFDKRGICALAFSPDGQRLAIGGGSQRVDVYRLVTRRPSWRPPPVTAPVAKGKSPEPPKGASPEQLLVHRAHQLIEDSEGGQGLAEARVLLDKALASKPKLAEAYVERARVSYKQGYKRGDDYHPEALERARVDLRRALELEPDLFSAHLRMGSLNLFAKDYAAAEQAAQRCEQIKPGAADTQILFMSIAEERDQDEQVMLHARTLVEGSATRDELAAAYSQLRRIYERRGEYDAAEEAYRSLVNLEPESAWTKGNFASFLNRREKYDEAITWAQGALAQMQYGVGYETLAEAYAGKARLALEQNRRDDYERWISKAFATHPRNADAHYVRALALRRDHDEAGARRELEAALATDPEHRAAARALGR